MYPSLFRLVDSNTSFPPVPIHVTVSVPPDGFDWGSVVGSAIGVLGAFLVAFLTLSVDARRKRTEIRKRVLIVYLQLMDRLSSVHIPFQSDSKVERIGTYIIEIDRVRNELNRMIPDAYELGEGLPELLSKVTGELTEFVNCNLSKYSGDSFTNFHHPDCRNVGISAGLLLAAQNSKVSKLFEQVKKDSKVDVRKWLWF